MTTVTPIRVVVSNDKALLRSVLRDALIEQGFDVVGEGALADDTIAIVRARSPDVLITDIAKPGMDGLEMTRAILSEQPSVGVLILSAYCRSDWPVRVVSSGARGYLRAGVSLDVLTKAIRTIADGGTVPPGLARLSALVEHPATKPPVPYRSPIIPEVPLTPIEYFRRGGRAS